MAVGEQPVWLTVLFAIGLALNAWRYWRNRLQKQQAQKSTPRLSSKQVRTANSIGNHQRWQPSGAQWFVAWGVYVTAFLVMLDYMTTGQFVVFVVIGGGFVAWWLEGRRTP